MTPFQKLDVSLQAAGGSAVVYGFWYGSLALAAWLLLYVALRKVFAHRKISRQWPKFRQMNREFWQSLRSILIYALVTVPIVYAAYSGWTRFYPRISDYGWLWWFASVGVMIILHDTYFYWTHRLMHHPKLYRHFHRTHHASMDPTPWAAYSFSPLEALVQAGIGPLVAFTIPAHPTAFATFMVWQISFNVLGHCGYEVYPQWFMRTPLGWFLNSPTHHAMHHEKFRGNFSLYFNIWDWLMQTNFPDYAERFEIAASSVTETAPAASRAA